MTSDFGEVLLVCRYKRDCNGLFLHALSDYGPIEESAGKLCSAPPIVDRKVRSLHCAVESLLISGQPIEDFRSVIHRSMEFPSKRRHRTFMVSILHVKAGSAYPVPFRWRRTNVPRL